MKHFDPNKSYRTGDGEIVTGMRRTDNGWNGTAPDGTTYHWYFTSPGNWPTEIAPTFEAGKSYRTRGGDKAAIEDIGVAYPDYLTGRVVGGGGQWSWLLSGRINAHPGNDSPMDLLPGAIEDEPLIHGEPQKVNITVTEADRMQAQINDVHKRVDVHDRAKETADAVRRLADREDSSDLRQIHSRINRQAERIEELRARAKEHTQLYLDLSKESDARTSAMVERIEALEKVSTLRTDLHIEVTKRIAALEMLEEASVTGNRNYAHDEGARRRIGSVEEHLSERIAALENYTGLDVRSAQRQAHESEKNANRKTMLDQLAAKPTIKGGWVNVYRRSDEPDRIWLGQVTDKPEWMPSESPRIACIQIPDITEGEGL